MLKTRLTASAPSANFLLSFAGAIALGAATLMPAHADIKIGFQVPLTGPAATDGKSAQLAGQMAVEDINAAGGVLTDKIACSSVDTRGDPADAVTGAGGIPIGYGTLLVVYIALAFAVAWILRLTRGVRQPEPTRLAHRAAVLPDQPALLARGARWTFAALDHWASDMARGLLAVDSTSRRNCSVRAFCSSRTVCQRVMRSSMWRRNSCRQ